MLHPNGRANLAPGLTPALSAVFGAEVAPAEVVAYLAAVCAHPAYTRRFTDELTTPGVRVPITADRALWAEAVALGRQVVWVHTYGAVFCDEGRPRDDVRYLPGASQRILNQVAVTRMPSEVGYDPDSQTVVLGSGEWRPVRPEVFDYTVGGKNVVRSWVNYRKAVPGGKKTSPLDLLHTDRWPVEWSREFTDLLTVLTRLVSLEPAQAALLERILAGPLVTSAALRDAGVDWPMRAPDRRPDYSQPSMEDLIGSAPGLSAATDLQRLRDEWPS